MLFLKLFLRFFGKKSHLLYRHSIRIAVFSREFVGDVFEQSSLAKAILIVTIRVEIIMHAKIA